jgi:hypothetical protein
MARSAQSIRGLGLDRRRTAFSCRRTRISTSLAVLLRASRASHSVVRSEREVEQAQRHEHRSCPAGVLLLIHDPAAFGTPQVFDGVFLMRPELIDRWDLRIFVSTALEKTWIVR